MLFPRRGLKSEVLCSPKQVGPGTQGPPGVKHQPVASVGVVPRGLRYARPRADFATTHPSPQPPSLM